MTPISPALKNLLDAIRKFEAPKGYGQIYGGAKGVPKSTDVSKMTLKAVQALQAKMVKNGSASTACGGYQFIRKTLAVTMQEMGLSGKEVWIPALQDQMAVHLIEKRGLSRFMAGKISREAFANNLAMEWASLPVVTPINGKKVGQSYYAGDGLNKSHHKPAAILALVDALRVRPAPVPLPEPLETAPATTSQLVTPQSPPSVIEALQRALNEKNYPAGAADGKWGRITNDAVLSFNADHGLPLAAEIDLAAVDAAKARVIEAREKATVADLREREEVTVKGADQTETTGYVAGSAAAVGGGLTYFETLSGWWRSIKTSLAEFGEPGTIIAWLIEHWYLPTMGVMGVGMIILARRAKAKRLEEFKVGKVK